jgi:hypothetical protein
MATKNEHNKGSINPTKTDTTKTKSQNNFDLHYNIFQKSY